MNAKLLNILLEGYEELDLIIKANSFVRKFFKGESSGHDYHHTIRVFRNAISICKNEEKIHKVNKKLVYLSALLHDVDDRKISPETYENKDNAEKFLKENGVSDEEIIIIKKLIDDVSFKGKDTVTPDTIEGKIVQDADRLDAIGAIGIGRTFAFGGKNGREMHDPEQKPNLNLSGDEYVKNISTTINHFYEKLLLLKDLMNTESGKKIAIHRTEYMIEFLNEFNDEWDGIK